MKKTLFLAICAGFISTSCSRDNEDDTISIIGSWKPSATMKISGTNGKIISTQTPSDCNKKSTFHFKSDNNFTNHIFEEESNTGICTDFGSQTAPYSYQYGTSKIIIDGDEYEILKHTQHELQIVVDYGNFDTDNVEDKDVLLLIK